jgi:hypothetical protein
LGFYLSNDGGSDWQHRCMPSMFYKGTEYDPADQPLVGIDSLGRIYEAGSFLIDDDSGSVVLVGLQRSTDGGRTWSNPVPVMGHSAATAIFTWLTVDNSPSSPYLNSVYVSGVLVGPFDDFNSQPYNQVVVSRSHDGGATWKQVAVGPRQNAPYHEDRYTNVGVGRDGTIYVTWIYCKEGKAKACVFGTGDVMFSKSSDGGNTWSIPSLITPVRETFPLPNTTAMRVYDYPVIGADNSSGPYAGALYVAGYTWTGSQMRVGVIRSTDGGNTWAKAVPVAPPSETHDQFFPWLSVSSTGLVGVSWMDRRNDPANTNYQAFAAISRDGGRSFGPNVQLTTGFSDPNRGGEGGGWIGDYTGSTWAGPDFIAAWMDNSETPSMVDVVGGIRLK